MNYSNPWDAVPDVSLETRLIITENQCVVYRAPWADTVGHSHLVLRAGDALVYQQASGELYIMERLALERNFKLVRTDGP